MNSFRFLQSAASAVRMADLDAVEDGVVRIDRSWEGSACSARLIHTGDIPVAVKEIVLFHGTWPFSKDTGCYGDGYSMLCQYGGSIGEPETIGSFDDKTHYRLPSTDGFHTVYNYVLLSPGADEHILIGFASCRRFSGELRLADGHFEIVLDGENLRLEPGESWDLEELFVVAGSDRERLLESFAERIQQHHPALKSAHIPTGWCSWYCYGPQVTEPNIFANLQAISEHLPELKYVQIDDGYQAYMGDWLEPGSTFSDMERLCREIKDQGFEPAIWVAPFIAEAKSALFHQHPDWFIQDEFGNPLSSDRHSFGGWRSGPWYMLDGTHPCAREYLIRVFSTMREQWGCHYFKLDANMWGALPGGNRHLHNATKIEAYRMGMEAVLEGAGKDSFILGCNAPMWPSLGLVHGMRVTDDVNRKWPKLKKIARECFSRNWQHQRLWINDPDCIVLENRSTKLIDPGGKAEKQMSVLTPDEFMFHAVCIYASGGMVLSGDDLGTLPEEKRRILKKVLATPHIAASFNDDCYQVGTIREKNSQILCLFNWEDEPSRIEVELDSFSQVTDFWTDEDLGWKQRKVVIELSARSTKMYRVH
jgi:alpha-galactosidase